MSGRSGGAVRYEGEVPEPGRARIEDPDNADAWIEATYRDGWVGRKLIGTDRGEYEQMVHPFYERCTFCRRWDDPQMWGWGSDHCPRCDRWHTYVLPRLMEWLVDGEPLGEGVSCDV